MGICPIRCRPNRRILDNSPELSTPDCIGDLVVSLYDYPSYGTEEFTMRAGERLSIISDDGDFMMVKSATTGHESYIPFDYIAKVKNKWLFTGISRSKAEELLMLPDNQTGAFMVRESESRRDHHTLSILRRSGTLYSSVKNYRIGRLQNGWFYISPGLTFLSLRHLVEHYSEYADGLCCRLAEPCFIQGLNNVAEVTSPVPMTTRRPSIIWNDITRSVLFRGNRAESEHSLVSEGLREAISTYLSMTDPRTHDCEKI